MKIGDKILAYKRSDGSVGVRNYVLILPLDDLSNSAAVAVSKIINGTIVLPHPYGRLQFGKDLDLHFRTLIGTGSNANIAAVIVIGIEPNWTQKVVEGISKTGKPVEGFYIEKSGDLKTIEKASRKALEFVEYATNLKREEVPVTDIIISTKCGESDTTSGLGSNKLVGRFIERFVEMGGTALFGETTELTGGEHIVASRFVDEKQRKKFMDMFNEYQELVEKEGVNLLGSQPTQGNIAGGLSTIEEKALGNIQKIGNAKVKSALDFAEKPSGKGLHFMNTSSAAAEAVTLFAAGGAVLHLFPTGQGNIVGNPVIPVIKISANPKTVASMSEHIDVDASPIIRVEKTLDEVAEVLWEKVYKVANGQMTRAEILRHEEFVLTKLYRSA
jgi:(2R)-sulfolactate sulfo-lyase subunit beta